MTFYWAEDAQPEIPAPEPVTYKEDYLEDTLPSHKSPTTPKFLLNRG